MSVATAPDPRVSAPRDRGEDGPGSTRLGPRLLALAAVVVAVGALISALPGLDDVRRSFRDVRPGWLAVTVLLELGSCSAYVVAFRPTFCRSLPWGLSARIAFAEQGTNVLVPTGGAGGLALGAWALRRAGMSAERIARRSVSFFVLTSGVNFATAIIVGLALATGVLAADLGLVYTLGPALAAAFVLAVVATLGRVLPHQDDATGDSAPDGRVRRLLARGGGALGDGVRDAGALLRDGRPALVLGAVGYMALDAAALWAAFQALGGSPAGATFMLAYVLGQLGGLIPLPGGIGGTDGGLIGALVLYGTPVASATAAVLGYRLFQLMIPAVFGALALVSLRKHPGDITGPCD
jgi:uncharacterized membrane protein YbhN (UPF0104 family)